MARVTLLGKVPVYVVVDTDTNDVVQVVVDDEALVYDDPPADQAADPDGTAITDVDVIAAAKDIAEVAEWPRWDFGW